MSLLCGIILVIVIVVLLAQLLVKTSPKLRGGLLVVVMGYMSNIADATYMNCVFISVSDRRKIEGG